MIIKIRGVKKGEQVYLASVKGKDKDKVETPLTKNAITCKVLEATAESREYQGDIIRSFNLKIEAKEQIHIVNLGCSYVAKSIINCILGATTEQLCNFNISVYHKEGSNKVSCSDASTKTRIDWLLSEDEMKPLVEKTKNKSGVVVSSDDTLLVEKFTTLLEEQKDKFPKASEGIKGSIQIEDAFSSPAPAPAPAPAKEEIDISDIDILF